MKGRYAWTLLFGLGVALTGPASAWAGPPWSALLPFKHVEADSTKSYWLSEADGPWLIMATTFTGEGAQKQAHDLVLELRKKFKLTAYMQQQSYDHTDTVEGLGVDPTGRPKRMRYLNASVSHDIAVLVGSYDSFDDPKAQKTLKKIKQLRPDSLRVGAEGNTSQTFGLFREAQRLLSRKMHQQNKGFMRTAFITRNPLLSDGEFASQGLDPLVVDMNRDVQFSLLKCGGAYTVKVATFRGATTMILNEIDRLQRGDKMDSQLAQAAENAHRLTLALRRLGYEAYEFHERRESIVTVGSFDSTGHPRADGKIEINPAVHRIMQTFSAQRHDLPTLQGAMQPRFVEGVALDVQAIPIQVPRESIGAAYARKKFFR